METISKKVATIYGRQGSIYSYKSNNHLEWFFTYNKMLLQLWFVDFYHKPLIAFTDSAFIYSRPPLFICAFKFYLIKLLFLLLIELLRIYPSTGLKGLKIYIFDREIPKIFFFFLCEVTYKENIITYISSLDIHYNVYFPQCSLCGKRYDLDCYRIDIEEYKNLSHIRTTSSCVICCSSRRKGGDNSNAGAWCTG